MKAVPFLFPLFLLAVVIETGSAALTVDCLRCENRENPLGLDVASPELSWELESAQRGQRQTAYRVLVASDPELLRKATGDLWDSGKVGTEATIHVAYRGKPLASRMHCYWKVQVWDKDGRPSRWSRPAEWSMGLLSQSDWSARWISIPGPADATAGKRPRRSLLARKEFTLPARPTRATVYCTGLGMYELHINGRRVGEDVFTPGWTLYPKRVQYQTYDVAQLLRAGDNAVGAILGNGWWSGGLGWQGAVMFARPDQNLMLLVQLEIECADGSRHVIATDKSWRFTEGPILENTLYHGETCDSRQEPPAWDELGATADRWQPAVEAPSPTAQLSADPGPPLRVTQELRAQSIRECSPGVWLFDFGQNLAGRCRLTVKAPERTKLTIRHAEVLKPDGTIYTDNYRSARATDVYICSGNRKEKEVWEPRFTYRGFRYAELSGCPGRPTRDTLVARVLHSDVPEVGQFECSNPVLNQIWHNVRWGLYSNLHSVPTDCPQRDERLGWMGDAEAFAPTSCWIADMEAFYRKWTRDIRDSQKDSGATTNVSPVIVTTEDAAPAWGDAVTIVPWTVYQFYGDRGILEENYDAMKRWVEYMRKRSRDNLYERKGFGDWVAVEASPSEPIGSAYYYRSTRILADTARILQRHKDDQEYDRLAHEIAQAYQKKHFHGDDGYTGGTQTADLLPVAFGITPAEHRNEVVGRIVESVRRHGDHLTTGFLGTEWLLPVLAEYGQTELAYRIAAATTYPSLGYMAQQGATTIWELWNSDKAGPGMNSRNHFALGSMAQWWMEGLAGIQPDPEHPGFEHIIIRPHPAGDLSWVRAGYHSVRGPIVCEWRIARGEIELSVQLPPGTEGIVVVPTSNRDAVRESGRPAESAPGVRRHGWRPDGMAYSIQSGRYHFTAPAP